jgi:3-deoxy-D-arabino-heptulosonate 7-phosphate (DAHP) synthase
MPKVIITAQIADPVKFEEGFRTHGELFRKQTVNNPITFSILKGNQVACCFEPEDLDTYLEILESPETAEAITIDGVKRETVQVYVLDREFQV